MFKNIPAASLIVLFEITMTGSMLADPPREVKDYEWKMMSIVSGTYNWDTTTGSRRNSDLWATYETNQQLIKANILRGKKLGFNSVRIPLYYIDPHTYPYYNHAWPQVMGSGIVDTNRKYISNINDLIGFCRDNTMKVCLILFVYGGKNEMIYYNRGNVPGYRNLSRYAGSDSIMSNTGINSWFKDAMAWTDYILSSIDQSKIVAYELYNEAGPSVEFDWIYHRDTTWLKQPYYDPNHPYPYQPNNMFYMEMANYLHLRWGGGFNLMISISGATDDLWKNLWCMLNYTFTRPAFLSALNSYCGPTYSGKYFDILSIHDYHTYSSNIYYNTILFLEPYQSHIYQWCIGECGFEISSVAPDHYETDQAKYFQYFFQVVQDLDSRLSQTAHHLLGVGIWSVLDYTMGFDDHYGIMSSENPTDIRKRKAAYVIENSLAGLVANSDFEIGPDNDMNFGDTPWCNGWAAYYPTCCQEYHKEDYTYATSPGHGHVLQLNPAPTRRVGWSGILGDMIRVKFNTKATVSVEIKVSNGQNKTEQLPAYFTDSVFVGLSWMNVSGQLISSTSPLSAYTFTPNDWTTVSATYTAPANAYYAVPCLMAYSNNYTVQFDNIKYTPEWRPLISFNFDDDITYFNPKLRDSVAGWWTTYGTSSNQDGLMLLTKSSIVKTTHYFGDGGITAIRMRQGNEYAAVGFIRSQSAYFKLIGLQNALYEYPSLNLGPMAATTISSSTGNIYSTAPIQYAPGCSWLEMQFADGGFGNTRVREVAVFEHTLRSTQ